MLMQLHANGHDDVSRLHAPDPRVARGQPGPPESRPAGRHRPQARPLPPMRCRISESILTGECSRRCVRGATPRQAAPRHPRETPPAQQTSIPLADSVPALWSKQWSAPAVDAAPKAGVEEHRRGIARCSSTVGCSSTSYDRGQCREAVRSERALDGNSRAPTKPAGRPAAYCDRAVSARHAAVTKPSAIASPIPWAGTYHGTRS